MLKKLAIRSLTAVALSSFFVCLTPRNSFADNPWDTSTPRPTGQTGSSTDKDDHKSVYDVSPAAAKEAFARAEYDRAYSDLISSSNHARSEFYASNDYIQTAKAVEDARAAYASASQPILDKVHNDSAYRSLMDKRAGVDEQLKLTFAMQQKIDLASLKMQYGAEAGRMEAAALNGDSGVQQARAKLASAAQTLSNKVSQFEASLYSKAELVSARQAFEAAKSNLASAEAYLQGAMQARADTIDADVRRYSGQVYNNWNPYYNGYYGIGNGYYGSSIGIVQHVP